MTDAKNNQRDVVRKAEEILRKDFRKKLRVKDLAKRVGVTANYLSAFYSWEIGKTITEVILERRAELAKKMLRETSLKLYQIARAAGFGSPCRFSVSFRKYQGISPQKYREQVRNTGMGQAK